jgi:hypothetical protein
MPELIELIMSVGNVEKNMLDIIWWNGEICVGLGGGIINK